MMPRLKLPKAIAALPAPVVRIIALLVAVNIVAWAAAAIVLHYYPAMISPAVLSYTLGLRHALDADHISAIDLMTRRLIASGQRPVTVGTWFSLGHSTIVIITCVVVAATSGALRDRFDRFAYVGGIIGTSVSSVVLVLLCLGNSWVLYRLVRSLRTALRRGDEEQVIAAGVGADAAAGYQDDDGEQQEQQRRRRSSGGSDVGGGGDGVRPVSSQDPIAGGTTTTSTTTTTAAASAGGRIRSSGAHDDDTGHELQLEGPGIMASVFRKVFRIVDRPWKMYPLGVLFGLGFDTSSEIAVLGISSVQGAQGTSLWVILIFPLLFTVGMCMLDTTDGALMMSLYTSKAFSRDRVAILYYSIVLTGITVVVAAFIGIVQILSLAQNIVQPEDGESAFWDGLSAISDHFDVIGGSICGLFLVVGLGSVFVYKPWRRTMDRRREAERRRLAGTGVVRVVSDDGVVLEGDKGRYRDVESTVGGGQAGGGSAKNAGAAP